MFFDSLGLKFVFFSGKVSFMKKISIVDDCIGCDTCPRIAPHIFGLDSPKTCAVVLKQPSSKQEEVLCMDAIKACPVFAIICD